LNPTNDSERLLFGQLLETLVRIDCRGVVRPAIAESWRADAEANVWTLTLQEGARFPGGTPIKARHVARLLAGPGGRAAGIDSAVDLDDRRVRIRLHGARDTVPEILAQPGLALLDSLGSVGPPTQFDIPARDGRPAIEFQVARNGDPRDAIDRGVDLVVTRDPDVAEYVANRPEFVTVSLPWSRTYALLQLAGAEPINGIRGDSLRRSLASDVVQAEARPAEPPFWWSGPRSCRLDPLLGVARPTSPRIVYPRTDKVAQALAERIVALSGDTRLRASGLDEVGFATTLREGTERGYIVYLPRNVAAPCHESATLPAGGWLEPLIDTRARAIVHRGSPPLTVDWDGTIKVIDRRESSRGSP
jgi:hypothetical protein